MLDVRSIRGAFRYVPVVSRDRVRRRRRSLRGADGCGISSRAVTDVSQAVVPGATVEVTNTATNVTLNAATDDSGESAVEAEPITTPDDTRRAEVKPGDWVRVNLHDSAGVAVLTNPIYFR